MTTHSVDIQTISTPKQCPVNKASKVRSAKVGEPLTLVTNYKPTLDKRSAVALLDFMRDVVQRKESHKKEQV